MQKKILMIGNHPVRADLARQYSQRGDHVVAWTADQGLGQTDMGAYDEFVLLADDDRNPLEADNQVMGTLQQIAASAPAPQNQAKPLCHLLLRSHSLLHLIRMDGFRKEIEDRMEVNAFTIEDQWARAVAMRLDTEPVTKQSEKTVHLVLFGMTEAAEQVAVNAAHVCHYPNYLQTGHTLRTRITVIDPSAFEKSREWIQKYKHLFDNSYYRFVDVGQRPAVVRTSCPMYQDREDFVDIEWEFVAATAYDDLVRSKLAKWADSPSQLLTIVLAGDGADGGLDVALHLPDAVVSAQTPVYVHMQSDKAFRQISGSGNTLRIIPFGMVDHGYDVNIPLVRMAKYVNYIYDRCYADNIEGWNGRMRFSVDINEEDKEKGWFKKSSVKRMSNIYNAMTIGVKMRSMGFKEDEWEKVYDLSQEDIELLAEVEHNRWSVEELILGWRPCTDEEQREVEADIHMKEALKRRRIHYDLRAYHDLRPDGTGKPVQVYDRCLSACIPLIAKESKGGEL